MVEFVATAGSRVDMRFFFNLTSPVGRGYPNARSDDVSFVQLCFALLESRGIETPEIKRACDNVKVTGRMDGETQAAIDVWQAYRKTLFGRQYDADGIISVAPPFAYYVRDTPYEILTLNWTLMVDMEAVWPRVDRHPRCIPRLGTAIRTSLGLAR
jgi:hypothetical protein